MGTRRTDWSNGWLLQGHSDGKASFEVLTRPHIAPLWRVALRMTSDRDAADDLTQETCLRAFRAFDRFEQGTNYRAWLFRIMRNLCLDHLRRRARSPLVAFGEDYDPAQSLAPEADRPDAQLVRKRFREEMARAMQRLPPAVRLVVSLALLEGLSYREMAEIVGCPVGTIRSRLSRGRAQLQQDLKDYLPNPAPTLRLIRSEPPRKGAGRNRPARENGNRSRHGGAR